MTEPVDDTPLPDSDDPYDVLGVEADADERALKRAYTRLIKRFRPDRDPEQFRRVRAAYERALAGLEAGELWEQAPPTARSEERRGPPAEDTGADPIETARAALIAGSIDEARLALERAVAGAPRDGRTYALGLLVERAAGFPVGVEGAAWLVRGFRHGAAVLGSFPVVLGDELDEDEWTALLCHPELGWPTVKREPDRRLATAWENRRIDELLCSGATAEALAEVNEEEYARDAQTEETLRLNGLAVACAVAWSHPEEAAALDHRHARDATLDESSLESHFDERRRLRASWQRWRARSGDLPVLVRFLELHHSVSWDMLPRLVAPLFADLQTRGLRYLDAFADMAHVDETLLHFHFEAVNTPTGRSEPTGNEARAIRKFMLDAEEGLRFDRRYVAVTRAIWVLLGLSLLGFLRGGVFASGRASLWTACALGLVPLVGVALCVGWLITRLDAHLYREIVRPEAVRLLVGSGLSVDTVATFMSANATSADHVGRFEGELRGDVPLFTLERTVALPRWLSVSAD